MSASQNVKIVVFVPLTHTDAVREAIASAGGGNIGRYSHCSFSSVGIGRFKPEDGAHPAIGTVGALEAVQEERIEFICSRASAKQIVEAIKRVHPYEEVALDVFSLEEI